jgi:hypothetical protein
MRKCAVPLVLILIVLAAPQLHAEAQSSGTAPGALFAKHNGAGITCAMCHKENPPAVPVQMDTCLGCHGPYTALADKTDKLEANPHGNHNGELACSSCHHMHKPSENYCIQCHTQYDFRVP